MIINVHQFLLENLKINSQEAETSGFKLPSQKKIQVIINENSTKMDNNY